MIRHSFRDSFKLAIVKIARTHTEFSWLYVLFTRPKETIFLCIYVERFLAAL